MIAHHGIRFKMHNESIICPICKRETPFHCQEKHHMIPRQKKGKITILVCCSCGDQIHQIFTNKELAKKYNTVEAIVADERIQKWVEWISRKPNDFSICMATKKRR